MKIRKGRLTVLVLTLSLAACGAGRDENPVAPGSEVIIAPDEITWDIEPRGVACAFDENNYVDEYLNIAVTDKDQIPLGDVKLSLSLTLSDNTFSGSPWLRLYDDLNGNGAVDHPDELVSGEEDGVHITTTDEFNGNKTVFVRVNLSCPYRGSLTAVAGAASARTHIAVEERDDEEQQ